MIVTAFCVTTLIEHDAEVPDPDNEHGDDKIHNVVVGVVNATVPAGNVGDGPTSVTVDVHVDTFPATTPVHDTVVEVVFAAADVIVHVNGLADARYTLAADVTVTTTLVNVPGDVGVPETTPEVLIAKPVGNPVADHVHPQVSAAEGSANVIDTGDTGVIAEPLLDDWFEIEPNVIALPQSVTATDPSAPVAPLALLPPFPPADPLVLENA